LVSLKERGRQRDLRVSVLRTLKGDDLPRQFLVQAPHYVSLPDVGAVAIWFGTVDGAAFQITHEAFIAPGSEEQYFLALLSPDLPRSVLSLLEQDGTPVDIKSRALRFLHGGRSPWPWAEWVLPWTTSRPEPIRFAEPDLDALSQIALRENNDEIALRAFSAYASLGQDKANPLLAERMWERRKLQEGYRLLAIAWYYWPDKAAKLAVGVQHRLMDYDPTVALNTLAAMRPPFCPVTRLLLCHMLEDDAYLGRTKLLFTAKASLATPATAPSELIAPSTVGGYARRLLHEDMGVWLPLDAGLAVRWLKATGKPPVPVGGFGVETPVAVSWKWSLPERRLHVLIRSIVAEEVVLAVPTALDISTDASQCFCPIETSNGDGTAVIMEPGALHAVAFRFLEEDEEFESDLANSQRVPGSLMYLHFPRPVAPAAKPVWFGTVGALADPAGSW
jgi:hypothetical protein